MSSPETSSNTRRQVLDHYDQVFLSALEQDGVEIADYGEMVQGLNLNGQFLRVSRPALDTEDMLPAALRQEGRKYIVEIRTQYTQEGATGVYDLKIFLADESRPHVLTTGLVDLGVLQEDEEFVKLLSFRRSTEC